MKILLDFITGLLIGLSIILIMWAFSYADSVRFYEGTGGEVFTIALPLMIIYLRVKFGQKNKKQY
jgi:hypothetical protein